MRRIVLLVGLLLIPASLAQTAAPDPEIRLEGVQGPPEMIALTTHAIRLEYTYQCNGFDGGLEGMQMHVEARAVMRDTEITFPVDQIPANAIDTEPCRTRPDALVPIRIDATFTVPVIEQDGIIDVSFVAVAAGRPGPTNSQSDPLESSYSAPYFAPVEETAELDDAPGQDSPGLGLVGLLGAVGLVALLRRR